MTPQQRKKLERVSWCKDGLKASPTGRFLDIARDEQWLVQNGLADSYYYATNARVGDYLFITDAGREALSQ